MSSTNITYNSVWYCTLKFYLLSTESYLAQRVYWYIFHYITATDDLNARIYGCN